MENLCEDVISKILSFLPVKFLHDSARLVCRSWFAVIRSPSFCKEHYNQHSSSNSKLLVMGHFWWLSFLNLENDKLETCSWTKPIQSVLLATSGGVLLVRHTDYDDHKKASLYAKNPLTRQQAELPPLPIGDGYHINLHNARMAYIPGTGEYKVVCPSVDRRSRMVVCFFVLTLGENMSWRRIDPETTVFSDEIRYADSYEWASVSAGGIIYFYNQLVAVDLRNENIQFESLSDLPILRLPGEPRDLEISTESLDMVEDDFPIYSYFQIGEHLGRLEYVKDRRAYGREEPHHGIFSVARLEGFGSNNCYWSELIFDQNSAIREFYDEVAWVENSNTLIFCSTSIFQKFNVTYNVKCKEIKHIDRGSLWPLQLFVHNDHFARW